MTKGTEEARAASFGDWLKRARESRALSLESVSGATKIPRRHLEALEHGSLGVLPDFYLRAEVRAFARAVGVEEQLAVARLQSVVAPVEPEPEPEPAPEALRKVPKARPVAIYVPLGLSLALMAALCVALLPELRTAPAGNAMRLAAGVAPIPATRVESASQPSPGTTLDGSAVTATSDTPLQVEPAGVLVVTTEPPGAQVTVNGIGWGPSPVTIRHLTPGDKRIRATKDGYPARERVLTLGAGGRLALDIHLGATQ